MDVDLRTKENLNIFVKVMIDNDLFSTYDQYFRGNFKFIKKFILGKLPKFN